MLLSFSITNFRSFREEQTLSLVASNRQNNLLQHLSPVPDDDNKVLPIAVVYGANGAGKSNLVKGLAFVQRQVLFGSKPGRPILWQPFLLGKDAPHDPSSFNLQLIGAKHAFAYGFRITSSVVTEEWLVLLREGREIVVFERLTRPDGSVEVEPGEAITGDGYGDHSKVVALAKVGVRANQLFLASVRDSLDEAAYGPLLQEVVGWFVSLQIVMPEADFLPLADWIAKDPAFADFAGNFLRDADTGVQRLKVETVEVGDGGLGLPQDFIKELVEDTPPGEVRVRRVKGLGDVIAQRDANMKIRLRRLLAEHNTEAGKAVSFPFQEEADGTQRLTHLLPALYQLRHQPRIYVIDEIDRSLHPLLAKKFVEYFLTACQGGRGQLIFTTHETNFLDQDLLRRDEYWFAAKDQQSGATELYSLDEYRIRTDLKLDKGYVHGRFGAVPLLGRLENQIDALRRP
jgi:energy-coupling factor transporter ATP-binding protein EcfA2